MPWYDERHALRRLKAEVDIPISAGETEFTPFGLRTMVAEGLVDYLIIDSTWAGGPHGLAQGGGHGRALPGATRRPPRSADPRPRSGRQPDRLHPRVLRRREPPLWFELFRERPTIVDGFMAVPDAPGLGLELREDTLEKYGVRLG